MSKIEPFEKFTDEYDKWFDKNRELYEAELKVIRQLITSPCARGLEIGVGTGKFAVPLGIKIGVEPSEKMAVKATKQGISVYPGVAENLPFPDAQFDFVLMVTTICFIDNISQSFREAYRVLKPDGFIIVGFVDKESDLGRQYANNRDNSRFYKDATFYSTREVLERLEDAAFEIAIIRQTLISGESPKIILDGFGKGAFVVIKAVKIVDD